MIVRAALTILNQDGSIAMATNVEEEVPPTSHDPTVNGQRALMKLYEVLDDARDRIGGQAAALGVVDES